MKTAVPSATLPSSADLRRAARMLRLLAHPQRLRIVALLERSGGAPVHALTAGLRLPQAAVSGHLARMRAVGLVQAERQGREVRYRIADTRPVAILNCIRACPTRVERKENAQ